MKGMSTLQKACCKSTLYLKRHSPTILTCVGAVGVVLTSVMAVKSTPKALKLLEQATYDKGEDLNKLEVIQVAGPVYIPAIIACAATISCIFGANVLNKRSQASLASAYAMLDQSYKQYRKAANSVYGVDADSKIKAEVAKKVYVSEGLFGTSIYDPDSVYEEILFYDNFSQRYFTSTMTSVVNAQYHLNRNFVLRGEASLNELYEFMGLEKVYGGDSIGWDFYELMESGIQWIDFENRLVKMDDGLECYIVSALFEPTVLGHDD